MNVLHAKSEISRILRMTTFRHANDMTDMVQFLAKFGMQLDALAMPEAITITLGRRVPSQNQFTYRDWVIYKREKDKWTALIRAALPRREVKPTAMVFVTIISYRQKLLDFGNLVGGAKPIPDVLQELNYLRDDTPDWATIRYHQHTCPKKEERTIVVIHMPEEW